MALSAQKPTAIIFGASSAASLRRKYNTLAGGLNTCSRTLAAFLVPPEGEALVSVCQIGLLVVSSIKRFFWMIVPAHCR